MSCKSTLLAAVSFIAASGLGVAQNFTYDNTDPYGPNTYRTVEDYVVDAAFHYGNLTGTGPNPYGNVYPVGMKETVLTLGDGGTELTAFDLCSELFVGPTGNSSYSVDPSLLTSAQRILLSNALPFFLEARDDSYPAAAVHATAIQLAFWEITEDGDSDYDLQSGNLYLTAFDVEGLDSVLLAQSWLALINSGEWTDQGGLHYYYADSADEQDRLWVTFTPIPEPSAVLLGLFGFGLVLRRRR